MLSLLPELERIALLNKLSEEEAFIFQYDWDFWARPSQKLSAGDWFNWLLCSGEVQGKRGQVQKQLFDGPSKSYSPVALVGQTKANVRDTMVEMGESSIIKIAPPWFPLEEN